MAATSTDRDYADKEWFAQAPEELPWVIQFLDKACLVLGGLGLAAIVVALLLLTGCATPLERMADKCYVFQGSPKGTQAGEAVTFECKR
jgi:hypothetical protein